MRILRVWVFSRPSLESAHIVYAQTHWLDLITWHHLAFREAGKYSLVHEEEMGLRLSQPVSATSVKLRMST